MIINDYEKRRSSADFSLTPDELQDAYKDIYNLLQHFQELTEQRVPKAKMQKDVVANMNSIRGFALFLLDHRGAYDKNLEKDLVLLDGFAKLVIIMGIPFCNAEHRLLEITKDYKLALSALEKPNVAFFVIANIHSYTLDDYKAICKYWHSLFNETDILELRDFLASPVTCLYHMCK